MICIQVELFHHDMEPKCLYRPVPAKHTFEPDENMKQNNGQAGMSCMVIIVMSVAF